MPDRVIPLISVPPTVRRRSLVEELVGADPSVASSRVNTVLSELSPAERSIVLKDYEAAQGPSAAEQQPFFMARLLDALFDRKSKIKAATAAHTSTVAIGQVGTARTARHTSPQEYAASPAMRHRNITAPMARVSPQAAAAIKAKLGRAHSGPISGPTVLDGTTVINDRQIGDYVLLKTLGKGTFGKVKLAEHCVTKEMVAIKTIERVNIKTAKQKTSVDREVRLMKLLHHPNIVGVKDVYETPSQIFIVMEHACGGELFDYIVKHGMVKEPEARSFFRQMLSAVDFCHKNSVIHRDLKPENLLLDKDRNIKIIDFGFGNTFHRERLLDTYCGSPFYAAPEMIQGIRYVGPEVDVWSMGVILFALLSGRLPFDATSMNELYEKIAKGKYTCPSHFSGEAVHLISRMLSVDPKRRATIEEIRQHAWINVGYPTLIDSHVKPRAPVVMEPQPESFSELLSYGFTSEDTRRILQTERNQHPIVSLYHLIEEARQRQKASHAAQDMCLQQSALDAMEAQSQRTNSLATIESAHSTAMEIASAAAEAAEQQSVRSPAMLVDVTEPPAVQQRQYNIPDVATSVVYPAATRTARPMTAYPSGTAVAYPPAAYIAQRPESAAPTTYSPRQPPAINAFFPPQSQEGTVPEVYKTAHGAVVHTLQHPVRGFFNIQTASTRPFPEIVAEVERVLRENVIAYRRDSTQLFVCEDKGNRFEIEVCEQHGAAGAVHDLFLRRLRGNVWTHKRICTRLVDSMQL